MYVIQSTKSWAQRRMELGLPPLQPYTPRRLVPIVKKDYMMDLSDMISKELVTNMGIKILMEEKLKEGDAIANTISKITPTLSLLIDETIKELIMKDQVKKDIVKQVTFHLSTLTVLKMENLLRNHHL